MLFEVRLTLFFVVEVHFPQVYGLILSLGRRTNALPAEVFTTFTSKPLTQKPCVGEYPSVD